MRELAAVTTTTRSILNDPDPIQVDEIRCDNSYPTGKAEAIREHGRAADAFFAAIRDFKLSGGKV